MEMFTTSSRVVFNSEYKEKIIILDILLDKLLKKGRKTHYFITQR